MKYLWFLLGCFVGASLILFYYQGELTDICVELFPVNIPVVSNGERIGEFNREQLRLMMVKKDMDGHNR